MKRLFLTAFCGLFLAPGSFAIVDTNNNGVSDFWERTQNNGELFPATFDPQADSDSDGWTNAQEAAAGTNPFDPNPPDGLIRPEIAHIPAVLDGPDENGIPVLGSPETVTVTWPTLVGKQYTLLFSPDLTEGSWIPVGEPFIAYGGVCKYDFYEVSATDKCFWRVSVGDVDSDSDGLNNYEEHLTGTDPTLIDSDGDTLSDSAELIAGTDPLQADADGDGWTDPQEIAAGTDSRNQDSDGDGIPDPIDAQPLVSALAFPDADGDGIADSDDANPNDPRGPAPLIASETVSGNPVSNLVKDETARFILSVANPGGPAPTASNLTIFLNGAEDTADITAIGSTGSSTQRFLLTWTAKTTTDYPNRTLQNLTLRFRDAQMATTWLKLARIDVAQWEGMIAISPIRYSTADEEGISLLVESHINGKRHEDDFGGPWNGSALFYRGPIAIPVINNNSHNTVATFQIPAGIKFPLFITRITGSSVSNVSTIEAGDNAAFPHNAALFYNNLTSTIRYDWGGVVTEVGTSSSKVQDYGTTWSETPISIHWLRQGQWQPVAETVWSHASPFTAYVDRAVFSAYHETPTRPRVTGFSVFSKLPASITPHLAGTVDVPGMPLHPLAIKKEGTLFPVPAEIFHQITYRVDPAVEQLTNGVKLRLGRSDENGVPLAPQPGIHLYQDAQGQPLPLDANGDILLSPTANSTLFQSLISQQGLNLLLKRTTAADDSHELQIRFVSKYESGLETTAESVKILPCDIVPDWNRDGKIDSADYGKATGEHPWRFWINDDDDAGETGGDDVSRARSFGLGGHEPDYVGTTVDGIRDLVDFFPAFLDLKTALKLNPKKDFQYYLKCESSNVAKSSFHVIFHKDGDRQKGAEEAGGACAYLKSVEDAGLVAGMQTMEVSQSGLRIPDDFLDRAAEGMGIALVEGVKRNTSPLVLEIRDKQGKVICQHGFPVSISGVEEMFRHKNLRADAPTLEPSKESNHPPASERLGVPSNLPDELSNEDWLVFLHGYNVNGERARGWHSEAFKRLFWSGSKAKFVGISWYGDQTQIQAIGVTPKYYENVENGLNTAAQLSAFVNSLAGGKKYLASHSLGGLVVSSAIANEGMNAEKAFLFDPALPTESLLPASAILNDIHMEPSSWRNYPEAIKASEWSLLFAGADARSGLTWRGRFHSGISKLKIFFSEGEEVLAALPPTIPADPGWAGDNPTGQYAFAIQAMLKGELGNEPNASQASFTGNLTSILASSFSGISPASDFGGWGRAVGFQNPKYIDLNGIFQSPSWFQDKLDAPDQEGVLFRLRLQDDPPFRGFGSGLFNTDTEPEGCEGLFTTQDGPQVAATAWKHRRILAQMIPERTLPAGGAGGSGVAGVAKLEDKYSEATNGGSIEVFDMQANRNGWPQEREDPVPGNGWRHGDVKDVAYTHVWKAWEEIITDSGIDRDP